MNPRFNVKSLSQENVQKRPYDLFLCAVGFETRARFIAVGCKPNARRRIATAFLDRRVIAFEDNRAWFKGAGYEVMEHSDETFDAWITDCVRVLYKNAASVLHIAIDISSMSRVRIASVTAAVFSEKCSFDVDIDWVYSSAAFSEPPKHTTPIVKAEPVLPLFAGRPEDPEKPISAIIGIGYEYEKALGSIEFLEPASVYAFRPTRHDRRYTAAIDTANASLWSVIDSERIINYTVDHPVDAFVDLESLIYGCLRDSRPVIIPFGPKVFFLSSLLVAIVHEPLVSVWRVSSGEYETPIDRIPDGKIVAMRTRLFCPATERLPSRSLSPLRVSLQYL